MLPIAGIGSGVTPAPKICASAVDCAAIEPASCSATTISRMAMPEHQPDRRPRRPASAGTAAPDRSRPRSGASIGQTTSAKATVSPSRTRAGITRSPKPGSSIMTPLTRANTRMNPASPAWVRSSSRAEPLEHQASPSTAGRAPVPISSKDSTGLRMPLAISTVCRNRRRLVEVTTAG